MRLKSYDDPFQSRLNHQARLRNQCRRLLLVTIPEIQGGVLEDMAGSKLHPSLLPNHGSSREDQSEWAHSIRVWSSILYHRLMRKIRHLRKDPVNSRHSSTNQWTYRSQSFIPFLSKDHSRKSRTLSVGNQIINQEPPLNPKVSSLVEGRR